MATAPTPAPIPRKRRLKAGGHGHHGGAWKIAYADMVTAMMAFFLVMWICGMDVKTRLGIADYFSNPSALSGPEKPSSWYTIPAGGKPALSQGDLEQSQERGGEPESEGIHRSTPLPLSNFTRDDAERLAKILRVLLEKSGSHDAYAAWVIIEVDDDALRLEFIDAGRGQFFTPGTATWTRPGKALVAELTGAIGVAGLAVACDGHVASEAGFKGDSRFHLGADMAFALRDLLVSQGLPGRNLLRVASFGWSQPRFQEAEDARNTRVALVIPYRTGS